MIKKTWWVIKCFFGFGSVMDGSICWFSARLPWLFDAHDYNVEKGGDGVPCCFAKYKCHKCGKEFGI